ncbi:MAG TPA: hypothetical protein VIK75_08900 [Calditerricola sp.]
MNQDTTHTAWVITDRALLNSDRADLAVIEDGTNTIMSYTVLPVRYDAAHDDLAAAVNTALTEAGWEPAGLTKAVDTGEVIPVQRAH